MFTGVVPGNKTPWRKGVSGTSIQFDGHKIFVSFPAKNAPHIKEAITLEGWAAMAASPWSWLEKQTEEETDIVIRD